MRRIARCLTVGDHGIDRRERLNQRAGGDHDCLRIVGRDGIPVGAVDGHLTLVAKARALRDSGFRRRGQDHHTRWGRAILRRRGEFARALIESAQRQINQESSRRDPI